VKVTGTGKRCSLLPHGINYELKKFNGTGPRFRKGILLFLTPSLIRETAAIEITIVGDYKIFCRRAWIQTLEQEANVLPREY
jgi:hypothetical protein